MKIGLINCLVCLQLMTGLATYAQPKTLAQKVMIQLNMRPEAFKEELIAEKQLPYDNTKSVIVLPKIGELEEHSFSLDSYILLVNSITGKIISRYTEDYSENGWVSDAVRLEEITIDTAPYKLSDETRAFGIRVSYEGSSRANPYSAQTISLFVEEKDSLKCVLHNFEISKYNGEWDTRCAGSSRSEEKVISLSTKKTNGYYDILVYNTIKNTKSRFEGEDCKEQVRTSKKQQVLKYQNGQYQ